MDEQAVGFFQVAWRIVWQQLAKLFSTKGNKDVTPTNDLSDNSAISYRIKPCHEGNILFFKDPESSLHFYGGGAYKGANPYAEGFGEVIVFDLADNFPPLIQTQGFKLPAFEKVYKFRRVLIEWPDGKGCQLLRSEWEAVLADLRKHAASVGKDVPVLLTCTGGHGRTGTCAAIFALLTKAYTPNKDDKKDVVEWLRDKYCKEIVESADQITYIEHLFKVKLTSKGAKDWTDSFKKTYPVAGSPQQKQQTAKDMAEFGMIRYPDGSWHWVGKQAALEWLAAQKPSDEVPPKDLPKISTFVCLMCGGDLTYGTCEACGLKEGSCSCVPAAGYGKEAYQNYFAFEGEAYLNNATGGG